jgi:hypothetical protein
MAAVLEVLALSFSAVTVIELALLVAPRRLLLSHWGSWPSLCGFLRRVLHGDEHVNMKVITN